MSTERSALIRGCRMGREEVEQRRSVRRVTSAEGRWVGDPVDPSQVAFVMGQRDHERRVSRAKERQRAEMAGSCEAAGVAMAKSRTEPSPERKELDEACLAEVDLEDHVLRGEKGSIRRKA